MATISSARCPRWSACIRSFRPTPSPPRRSASSAPATACVIGDGLVLTIGYLITEAETVWLHLGDGRVVQGHALGFDQETGFGLVQALGSIDLPALPIGSSAAAEIGERVVLGGAGGRTRSVAGAHRRQAGIRRLLGIRARRGDLHLSGASQLGRHRADFAAGRTDRHRLAAARARARRQERESQHGGADRSAQADPRRPAQIRPRQQAGAALARALFDRDRGQDRGGRHRRQGPGGARRDQDRRRDPGGQRRDGVRRSRNSTARSGRSAMPASKCRSRSIAKASPSTCG